MPNFKVLEVVSGLGLGGAEKSLISRLSYQPDGVDSIILNIRPQIDSLKAPNSLTHLQNEGNFFQNILFLRKSIHNLRPTVVTVRTPADVIRLAIVKLVFRQRFSLIFEAHSNFVTKKRYIGKIFVFFFNLAGSQIDGVIAVSKSVSKGPLCKGKVPKRVCYLGSDFQVDASSFKEIQQVRFLFVGRMVDVKRPLWLIDRFSKLSNTVGLKGICLTIVGDGPLLESAKALVSTRGLDNFVALTGQKADVFPYFMEHNYLVSCSENEGLPITFYEAKLAGLRIISTPSGGGHEILSETDFVTSGFSDVEFEDALARALVAPVPTLSERRETSDASAWMSAKSCAASYYKTLFELLGGDGFR